MAGQVGSYYLIYTGEHQPDRRPTTLPSDGQFKAEVIDTWTMTVTPIAGTFSGKTEIPLPSKPFQAVRITRVTTRPSPK